MLFHEKVGLLLERIGASHTALARASGLDASLISRFHRGERVPSRFSHQLDKLSMGAATLAVERGMQQKLCALCGMEVCSDTNVLSDAMGAWLNLEESGLRPQRAHRQRDGAAHAPYGNGEGAFAERLGALMEVSGVTNLQLAQYLNIEASLVSRFRAGVRRPEGSGRLVGEICAFFSMHPYAGRKREAFFELINIPETEDRESVLEVLRGFLQAPYTNEGRVYADRLLETLDVMRPHQPIHPASGQVHPAPPVRAEMELYSGNAGLRQAAQRLFAEAASSDGVRRLRLFSDLSAAWTLGDASFVQDLPGMIRRLMQKEVRLELVVSLDAELSGMVSLLGHWMPLLSAGRLHVYLLSRPAKRRFSGTIFLADNACGVYSFCISQMEQDAFHTYTERPELMEHLNRQFDALISAGCELAHVFGTGMEAQYHERLAAFERSPGDTDVLLHSLSAYTITPSLMARMLKRTGVADAAAQKVLRYHQLAAKRAARNLSLYRISDYIRLADPKDLKAGRVRVELPWVEDEVCVTYTPEEYAEHIAYTLTLLRKHPHYSVYLLPELPFENVMIMVRQGAGTLIKKLNQPALALFTEHPALLQSISDYTDALKLRSMRVHPERGRALKAMQQYLQPEGWEGGAGN